MKSMIVYKGKYGATEQYAKWLAGELQWPVADAEDIDVSALEEGSLLIMGSSVYIGKLQLAKWLRNNERQLEGLQLVLFVVSGTPLNETTKLFSYVKNSLSPALFKRCRIFFLPGRMIYDRLSRRDRFMLRIGALFAGREAGAKMLAGYDDVKKEHLGDLFSYLDTITEAKG